MEEKIRPIGVRFKHAAPEELMLVRQWDKCFHRQFLVDETKAEVECAHCHEKLNPMWVLAHLATENSKYHEAAKRYQEEMQRIKERSRTKCERCGEMTRISHR